MARKLYAITTGVDDEYWILGLCSSKKAANNIYNRLVAEGYDNDELYIEEYEDLFFLKDNTFKPYNVQFSVVSDGEKDIMGGVATEADFGATLRNSCITDCTGTLSIAYVFAHDTHDAVRTAKSIYGEHPKTNVQTKISLTLDPKEKNSDIV